MRESLHGVHSATVCILYESATESQVWNWEGIEAVAEVDSGSVAPLDGRKRQTRRPWPRPPGKVGFFSAVDVSADCPKHILRTTVKPGDAGTKRQRRACSRLAYGDATVQDNFPTIALRLVPRNRLPGSSSRVRPPTNQVTWKESIDLPRFTESQVP